MLAPQPTTQPTHALADDASGALLGQPVLAGHDGRAVDEPRARVGERAPRASVDCVATKARSNGAVRLGEACSSGARAARLRPLAAVELAHAIAVVRERRGDLGIADDRRDVGAGARQRRRQHAADSAATDDRDSHGPESSEAAPANQYRHRCKRGKTAHHADAMVTGDRIGRVVGLLADAVGGIHHDIGGNGGGGGGRRRLARHVARSRRHRRRRHRLQRRLRHQLDVRPAADRHAVPQSHPRQRRLQGRRRLRPRRQRQRPRRQLQRRRRRGLLVRARRRRELLPRAPRPPRRRRLHRRSRHLRQPASSAPGARASARSALRPETCDKLDNDCNGCADDGLCCNAAIDCPAPGDPRIAPQPPYTDVALKGELFFPGAATSWSWKIVGGPCDQLFATRRRRARQRRASRSPAPT